MGGHFTKLDLSTKEGSRRLGDPRVILPFVLASLLLLLLTSTIMVPVLIVCFCLALLIEEGASMVTLARRLAFPMIVVSVLFVIQLFTYGASPLFQWSLPGITLVGYREGLVKGNVLAGRVLASVTLLVFLTTVIPVYRLLEFAGSLKIPRLFLLQCLMVYRFAALLVSEGARIQDAQTVRMGRTTFRNRVRSFQLMGVSVVLRCLERSRHLYDGARMRGASLTPPHRSFRASRERVDLKSALLFGAAFVLFLIAGRVFHVEA